jgi:hypothetical protein
LGVVTLTSFSQGGNGIMIGGWEDGMNMRLSIVQNLDSPSGQLSNVR